MKLLWWKAQFEFKLLRFSRAVHGGWHRTWEVCHWPWNVKSMIKAQDKASSVFPNTELDHVEKTDNSWLPTTSQLHFFALPLLCSGSFSTMVAVPELWFLRSRLCCKDLRSNVPKDQHSLEKRSWHHASTTSKVAPLRFGKTRMAFYNKQNYHCVVAGIELEKYAIGHDISNQYSRLKTRHLPQHKAGSPWKTNNRCLPKTSQLDIFALHNLFVGSF